MSTTDTEKKEKTFVIENMTCVGCARTLENEFRKFVGIEYRVSLADKSVTVVYSPAEYSRDVFIQAIESHGYRVERES